MPPPPPAPSLPPPPLAPVTLGLAAGIAVAGARAGGALLGPLVVAALGLACGPGPRRALGLALLLGLLLGRLHAPARVRPPELSAAALPAVHVLTGRVVATEPTGARAQRLVLGVDALGEPPRDVAHALRVQVRLLLRGIPTWQPDDIAPGARVRCIARVDAGPGQRLRAVVHDRRAITVLAAARGGPAALARLRTRAAWAFSRGLQARDDGLARALLLGDRSRLDARDRELFRRTGQAHLLAVSGLHVGLLLGGLLLVLRVLGAPARGRWLAGVGIVAAYVPFAGAQPSAVRAGLAAAAWFVARLLGRRPWGAAMLTFIALLVLADRPRAMRDVSFQLSFAAVAAILFLAPRLRAALVAPRPVLAGLLPRRRAPVRTALAISIAAWLGTAPFVAHYIGRLCPAGPWLSLLALPLTAVLLGASCVYLLASAAPPLAFVAARGFETASHALRTVLQAARDVHLGALDVAVPAAPWWPLYAAALGVLARARGRRAALGAASAGLLLAALFVPGGLVPLCAPRAAWIPGSDEYDARAVTTALLAADVSPPALGPTLLVGAALVLFALVSMRLAWLGPRASGAAWVLGMLSFLTFGGPGLVALLAPFLVATLLGRLPGAARAGARTLRQVLCNGVPAFLGCLIAISGRPDIGAPFFLGALACLGGDTCATEIGTRYGGRPFRLAGRGPIRRGESGGVTLAGLAATLVGAALAPAAYAVGRDAQAWGGTAWLSALGILTAAGVAGSLLDSVLGGALQFRGRIAGRDAVTEATWLDGAPTERVSGWRWLDNDAVNLVSGLAAGAAAVALTYLA